MKNANIITRDDAITKDIQPDEVVEQLFDFPKLGVSVMAYTMQEALKKAKAVIKAKK